MLQDSSSSPFDDAAARPFLNEPAKKTRWSWFSSSGTYKTAKFSLPSADDESNDHCDELDITYRGGGYDAPDLAHQELLQAEIADEEAMGDEGAFVLARLEGGTALDLAILEERHEGIANINFEMQKINEIQKEIALTVESQERDIDDIEAMALETAAHAAAGTAHIVAVHLQDQTDFRKKRRACMVTALTLVLMVGFHWAVSSSQDEDSYHGSPKSFLH